MWRTSTRNKGRYGIPGDGPSGPFFTPEACPDESRTNKRCARRVPPLSGRIWCGGAKAALGFAPPPAGRASALAGDPSPWPAPAAFNIRRPGMAAARTAATLFFGGSVWRPARRSGAGSSVLYCRRWGRGGPPAGVGSDAIGSTRCAHWSSQHVSAPAAGGAAPARDLMPPCPPRRGGRRLDNGKEGSVRETQEGCPSPLKSVVFEAFSKLQKLRQRGEKTFSTR